MPEGIPHGVCPQLLVSVRSPEEALAALAGGAALIDVKEPSRGSLGRADDRVIHAVARAIAGRRPVSAAVGEWIDGGEIPDVDLAYVKWGLAGCRRNERWQREWRRLLDRPSSPRPVLVAYADWECARAPSVEEVFALACDHAGSVLLIDTHCKDAGPGKRRPTLLDWLPAGAIEDLCAQAREAKVKVALAGSLGVHEIRMLLPSRPAWFAVRGAACVAGDRQAVVQAEKVRELVELLQDSMLTSGSGHGS